MKTKPLPVKSLATVFMAAMAEIQSVPITRLDSEKIVTHKVKAGNFQVSWRRDKEMESHYETQQGWGPTLYFITGFSDEHNPYLIDVVHIAICNDCVYIIDGNLTYEIFNLEIGVDQTEEGQQTSRDMVVSIIESILIKMSISGLINIDRGDKCGKGRAN